MELPKLRTKAFSRQTVLFPYHQLLSVAVSSHLRKPVLACAKGASLGKEAVLAASGRVGEIAVGVGRVRRLRSVEDR